MRFVIDLQSAQTDSSRFRGVGRYAIEMTKSFAKCMQKNDILYVVLNGNFIDSYDAIINELTPTIPKNNIKTWNWYPKIEIGAYHKDFDYLKPVEYFKDWFFSQFNADVIWSINFQEGCFEKNVSTWIGNKNDCKSLICCTLHDLTPLIEPTIYPGPHIAPWYFRMLDYACACDIILTPSFFSKKTISKKLNILENNILVAYNGVNKNRFFVDPTIQKKNYILYVGSIDPYKNVESLIKAFALLPKSLKKYKLVLCGNKISDLEVCIPKKIRKRTILINSPSDKKIVKLMQASKLFVFPSLSEGFGLPPLEAMSSGTVAIVSNTTSLPEIVGTDDALFNPHSVKSICNKMVEILTKPDVYKKIYNFQQKYIKKFSWDISANNIYDFFRKKVIEKQKIVNNKPYDFHPIIEKKTFKKKRYYYEVARSYADSKIFTKQHKLCIDLSGTVDLNYVTGIQRVCNALAVNLKQLNLNRENFELIPTYFVPHTNTIVKCDIKNNKFVTRAKINNDDIIQFNDGDVLVLADLSLGEIVNNEYFLIQLMQRGVRIFTILYDLIPINFPRFYPTPFVKMFKAYLNSISKFSGIIAISKFVINEYNNWIKKNKIAIRKDFKKTFFYLGNDLRNANFTKQSPNESDELIKQIKKLPTFLVVATIEPRKMHKQIYEAFKILLKKGININLVFVGRDGWKTDTFISKIKSDKSNHFFWINKASDEYLEKIYSASSAVIVASLIEGFGLPIIEAKLHKKPLILRDIPVFKEIAGNNAYYFKTKDAKELSTVLINWLKLYKNNKEPKSNKIHALSWKQSSNLFLKRLWKIY